MKTHLGCSTELPLNSRVPLPPRAPDGTYSYTYDANGNCVTRTETSSAIISAEPSQYYTLYSWDYLNRLVQVVYENSSHTVTETVDYTYDYLDRRIERTIIPASGAKDYSYLAYQGDQPYAQFDTGNAHVGINATDETDLYLLAPTVDQVLSDTQFYPNPAEQNQIEVLTVWLLPDQEGTIRDLAADIPGDSAAGAFVWTHLYYNAFGTPEVTEYNMGWASGTSPASALIPGSSDCVLNTSIGYCGGIYDATLGMVQFVDRWYDPNTARFLSPDPTGFAGGLSNLYCYCGNNPLTQTDPTGDQQGYAGSGVVFAAGYNQAPISLTPPSLGADGRRGSHRPERSNELRG